jgi:2-polyprenyl-3-methyl-5-hydroxy-6-metoxy-1,4-benzoquinol methylase
MWPSLTSQQLPGCTVYDISTCWSQVSPTWCNFVRSGHDVHRHHVHGPALLEACGDVRGLRVLDLGCGEGWCSRELARLGATVVGVDISEAQVAAARGLLHDDAIDYLVMDAAAVDHVSWPRKFDRVTACMALHDMVDPGAVLRAARSVLADDGVLVCSIPHPKPPDAGYVEAMAYEKRWNLARTGTSWTTIHYQRSLETYLRMFVESGFSDDVRVSRPRATADDVRRHPVLRESAKSSKYLVYAAQPAQARM